MTSASVPDRGAIVVDTSAVVAILLREEAADASVAILSEAAIRLMSAATLVELGIVVESRLGPAGADVLTRFLRDAAIAVVPVDAELAERALGGWRRYGKGRHAAGLNYGDCFTYALAEKTGHPVLCAGADFLATDVETLPASRP